jgi:AcrR family transcriptional regulator
VSVAEPADRALAKAEPLDTGPPLDRRQRRRQETIDEILALALEQMAEEGVGALSLSTVARRMGIRPPSLYQYFPSRLAVYDALFREGNRRLGEVLDRALSGLDSRQQDPLSQLRTTAQAFARWSIENPVFAQLMFWRPVPGFEPSSETFAIASRHLNRLRATLQAAVAAGQLAPAAAGEDGVALFTTWVAGVVSQQLANEPDAAWDTGRFTRLFPDAFDMYVRYFAPAADAKNRKGRK